MSSNDDTPDIILNSSKEKKQKKMSDKCCINECKTIEKHVSTREIN